jgi:hypothetical protein
MQVARQCEFLRAECTTRPAPVRFQHQHSQSALREYTRCHEAIRARTDNDDVGRNPMIACIADTQSDVPIGFAACEEFPAHWKVLVGRAMSRSLRP